MDSLLLEFGAESVSHWKGRLASFSPVYLRGSHENPSTAPHAQPGPLESLLVWLVCSFPLLYHLLEMPARKKMPMQNMLSLSSAIALIVSDPHLTRPPLPDLLMGWKKRKSWWFHSDYTVIKWAMILSQKSGRSSVRKQLIKAKDFLSKGTVWNLTSE